MAQARSPDVHALIGRPTHEKEPLGTKGWNEAVKRFKVVDAKREARWAQIRLGVQDFDERQATALPGDLYREMLARWPTRNWVAMNTWAGIRASCDAFDREFEMRFGTQDEYLEGLNRLHGERLDLFLRERGMEVSPSTWHHLLEATHRAVKLDIDQMLRETSGDWTPDRVVEKFPALEVVAPPDPKKQFEAVWEEYEALVKPKAATVRRWKSALTKMFEALGTTDMSKVTEEMLTDYMNARIKAGIHNNTVGKVDLAAAKRLFRFAKQQRFIASNPAIDVEVSSGAKYETDMRSFHPHEATIILRATLAPPSTKMAPAFAAARRWVPWICAYTGARVNEITQARACDFFVADGMTVLRVTDEAGTAKTGPRNVPLHPDLIDQGFGKFLATKKGEEPLFYTPREEDTAVIRPFEEMGARLSKWVRKLGITDLTLDPNHAWRHRFKGYSAKAGNDERVTDAIQGHAPGTQGCKYGEVDLEERIAAVRKLPRISIHEGAEAAAIAAE